LHYGSGATRVVKSPGNVVVLFLDELADAQISGVETSFRIGRDFSDTVDDALTQSLKRTFSELLESFPVRLGQIAGHRMQAPNVVVNGGPARCWHPRHR
jgi:hypothetical protein